MMPPVNQRGSITVFFLLFVLIAAGAISYSVYVGHLVNEKIKTHNAADAAAFSMAAHAAQGLNMMSTNNLAIGASLHIAAAAPIIGRYYALGQAFAVTTSNADEVVKLRYDADDTVFAEAYHFMAPVAGHFVQSASGLTRINGVIGKYWSIGALPKGMEQMRLNRPGSIGLPMQNSRPIGSSLNPLDWFHFQYATLRRTKPKDTMCHAIQASEGHEKRSLAVSWLAGPLESLGAGPALAGVKGALEAVEGSMQKLKKALNRINKKIIEPLQEAVDTVCDVKPKPWGCSKIDRTIRLARQLMEAPIPEFTGCGLNSQGDFGEQIENFLKHSGQENSIGQLGFVYPHVTNEQERKDFESANTFTMLVGMPLLTADEMPKNADGILECPAAWSYQVDGETYCEIMLGGIDAGVAKYQPGRASADGGLARAAALQGVVNPGRLANVWKRVQWSVSSARAVFRPDPNHRGQLGDPTYGELDGLRPDEPQYLDRTRMQLFWPAWQAELTHVTIWQDLLDHVGS